MDLQKINSEYEALVSEFGETGAAIVAGISHKDIPAALKEENKNTVKLANFLESRAAGLASYTEEQQALILKLEHLIVSQGSAQKAAAVIGKSSSVISNIRKGKYNGNVQDFFSILESYFNLKHEQSKIYKGTEYVPTSISECVYQTLRSVHIVGDCEIITGDTGIGKTRTITKYAADYPESTIVVTPTYADSSVVGIMKLIAAQLGIYGSNRLYDLNTAVLSKLHDGMLIIVDEAQHLKFSAIDHLRAIADLFVERGETMGVCFVGNPSFNRHFEERKFAVTGQVWNRANLRPYLKSSDIKFDDIKLLFPELTAENKTAELKFLYAIAQTNGEGIRRAVNFYKNAYDKNNGVVDIEYLAALAQLGNARIPNIGAIIKRLREEAAV